MNNTFCDNALTVSVPNTASKAERRQYILMRRKALSANEVETLSNVAQQRLIQTTVWQNARQVILYMPIRNEMDTLLLRKNAWATGKIVLFPHCTNTAKGEMCMAECPDESYLISGHYGIMEPDLRRAVVHDAASSTLHPDVALIPALAYDRTGNRLGFGAGYYDRYLSAPALQKTCLVGLGYSFQIFPKLPADAWDVPVNVLCTEKELTWL